MVRDRLRVMEQKINAHTVLSETDKVEPQQYITRCYGSFTSFNVLFDDKDDEFVGQKGRGEGLLAERSQAQRAMSFQPPAPIPCTRSSLALAFVL